MTREARSGEQPVPGDEGVPPTRSEAYASRRPPDVPEGDGDIVVEDDGSGMAGGASGSSGGGSGMPGHPDAEQ